MKKAMYKYLERYAEPDAAMAALGPFGHALVIPTYGEGPDLLETLRSVPPGPRGDVLVVLVLNARRSSPRERHVENEATRTRIERAFGPRERGSDGCQWPVYRFAPGRIAMLDRACDGHWFPEDQGVGLARKLGVDVCARLFADGRLGSRFAHTTDADAILPSDYFRRTELARADAAAFIYPFTHVPDPDAALARAIALYEMSLRYYVLGLRWARSPYAHHTIGSTFAVDLDAYAMVRGFPRRDAGEDFYILNKLAKVGTVELSSGKPLSIRGRPSDRVPFGTGAAVRRIAATRLPFRMYHPELFQYLRAWLDALSRFDARSRYAAAELRSVVVASADGERLDAHRLQTALQKLNAFDGVVLAAGGAKDERDCARRVAVWFDAFRTMKLLHALQADGLQKMHWPEALAAAPFLTGVPLPGSDADVADLMQLNMHLSALEESG